MENEQNNKGCALCQRKLKLTKHHLIPSNVHKNKWFRKRFSKEDLHQVLMVCRPCHNAIHRFIPNNKVLARDYYTLELLLAHEGLKRYVEWQKSH